uniref:Uncharacterized protein n=1 Tax=Tetranychus urticae TaxID=32264 RepID=T1K7C1_TETUR
MEESLKLVGTNIGMKFNIISKRLVYYPCRPS